MRRLGYGEHLGHGGQTSFERRITGGDFPRLHAYVEEKNNGLQINLHLDQKQGAAGGSMHGGEYEGPLVEQEMTRITSSITGMGMPTDTGKRYTDEDEAPKKGFWGSIFG